MRPQVPEQKGIYIGIGYAECDFDMYLYELLGFNFLERDIGSDEFWRKRTADDIEVYLKHLQLLEEACYRVSRKLEFADTIHTITIGDNLNER
jgi:hypothetical protein